MMFIKRTLAAGGFILASVAAAGAADLPVMVVEPALPPPVPVFGWAGPYLGAYGGAYLGAVFQVGLQGGYNFVNGNFLFGVEAQAGAIFVGGGAGFEGNLTGRLGFILGDSFLLYSEGGVGILGGTLIYSTGGGAEFAVGTSVSLFVEARAVGAIGAPIATVTVQGGINWHPNY